MQQALFHTEELDRAPGHQAWQSVVGSNTGRRAVAPLARAHVPHPQVEHSPHQLRCPSTQGSCRLSHDTVAGRHAV
eukprot:8121492-Alexandrium_andersonii.AAC.1